MSNPFTAIKQLIVQNTIRLQICQAIQSRWLFTVTGLQRGSEFTQYTPQMARLTRF